MEYILQPSILHNIYCYLTYDDLRIYKNVPDWIWKQMYDYFEVDDLCREQLVSFWGSVLSAHIMTYKSLILYFIKYLTNLCIIWPKVLKRNRIFMLECAKRPYGIGIDQVNDVGSDIEIMLELIKIDPYLISRVALHLQDDKDFIFKAVKCNKYSLLFIKSKWREDVEIIYEVARECGICYRHNNNLLELYCECITILLTERFDLWYLCGSSVPLNDQFFNIEVTKLAEWKKLKQNIPKYTKLYLDAPNRTFALIAIENGMKFYNLSDELLNDKIFMKLALKLSPYYTKNKKQKYDKRGRCALADVGNKLKKDKIFVLELMCDPEYYEPEMIRDIDPTLLTDFDILRCAIQLNPFLLRNSASQFQENKDIIRSLLKDDMSLFGFIHAHLKADPIWVRDVMDGVI